MPMTVTDDVRRLHERVNLRIQRRCADVLP